MSKQKIVITGSDGQLGEEIKRLRSELSQFDIIYTDIETLDITNEFNVDNYIAKIKPYALVNCAAYTAVDKAETDVDNAINVNSHGPANLSNACKNNNVFFIHVSTDYVFDGKSKVPYKEEDVISPIGVYGRSKAGGEKLVFQSGVNGIIIRTSWLYSVFGSNFVKTMLSLGKEKEKITVVNDQYGCPTNAKDLASAIVHILNSRPNINGVDLFHYSNIGVTSWYSFAEEIMKRAKLDCLVIPISSKQYPVAAPRPTYSAFDTSKISNFFNIQIPDWKSSLEQCILELESNI